MRRLSLAAALGSRVASVNTSGVQALITTLEEETLILREDLVMDEPNDLVLGLAAETEEEYFVAPLPAHLLPRAASGLILSTTFKISLRLMYLENY